MARWTGLATWRHKRTIFRAAMPMTPTLSTPARGPGSKSRPFVPTLVIGVLGVCALAALFWPRGSSRVPGGFLVDGSGRPAPLAEEMAPVTLVHFWATWCAPCLTEIPAITRLADEFETPGGFRVLLIAVADSPAKVTAFLGSGAGRALYDPSWEIAHRYGTRQLPETHLVARGKTIARWDGATDWDGEPIRAELRGHLTAAGVLASVARRTVSKQDL